MPIHFGTDGWRAVISDSFTFYNLRLVSQAIADAVASGGWNEGAPEKYRSTSNAMVVGFDTRFLSDRYARDVARVLAGNGFTVYLAQAHTPTPAISHAVRHLGARGRGNDYGISQRTALQRGQVEIQLWRLLAARAGPAGGSVSER